MESIKVSNPSKNDHPLHSANMVSQIMITWLNPLILLSSHNKLLESSVWDAPAHGGVQHNEQLFWTNWKKEKLLAETQGRTPSLLRALFRAFGIQLLIAGIYQFAFMCSQIGQPFLVGALVSYVVTGDGGIQTGLGYAFGLGAVSLISSLCIASCFYTLRQLGGRVRTAVMMAVYEHALNLTTAARMKTSVGQTTNLLAIDTEKLFLAAQFVHFIWQGPITSIVVMGIIVTSVGPIPAMSGMAFVLLLIPLQNSLATSIGSIRRTMVKSTDERSKLTNEFLQTIRIVKFYGWESAIENRIESIRTHELNLLSQYLTYSSYLRELLFSVQPLVALIIFVIAIYGLNQTITIVEVFRVLAFLNITRFPLNLLAQSLKNFKDGMVSIQRLNAFFLLPTVNRSNKDIQDETALIELKEATFQWQGDNNTETYSQSIKKPENKNKYKKIENKTVDVTGDQDIEEKKADDVLLESQLFSLQSINFSTSSSNDLIAVIGSVGSGKTSFMSALLTEMPLVSGNHSLKGNICYCAQTPWIQNMSLKDNVLFGANQLNFGSHGIELKEQYSKALFSAALEPDIRILPNGDMTEIGERGINLSGGQKARVSIARALFTSYRANIILMDDPFSAVDGSTGNHIFHQGVRQMLKTKIRILALNSHLHLLKYFDRIIVLQRGKVVGDGNLTTLMESKPMLMSKVMGSTTNLSDPSKSISWIPDIEDDPIKDNEQNQEKTTSLTETIAQQPLESEDIVSVSITSNSASAVDAPLEAPKKLVQEEKIARGSVKLDTYVKYFSAALMSRMKLLKSSLYDNTQSDMKLDTFLLHFGGYIVLAGVIFIFTIAQLARVAVDLYLARWAQDNGEKSSVWATVYFCSVGILFGSLAFRSVYLNYFSVRSAANIHTYVLRSVLMAPIPTFFDTHTVGEILNRFSKDTETVDANVPEFMLQLIINWWQVFSVFALCIYASYWFAIVLLPLSFGFSRLFKYFSAISRDLKRFESKTRSPIYSSLSETLLGLDTIRAYGDSVRFLNSHRLRMINNQKHFYHLWMSMSWVTVRLELTTSFILLVVSVLSVCVRTSVSPIALGLALTYGIQLTALFQRCVQISIDVSNYMTSTERLFEYLDIPHESSVVLHPNSLPDKSSEVADVESVTVVTKRNASMSDWPRTGDIQFHDVWLQYRDNEPVLRGISFFIRGGERVGVCGRTGAGKSSLMIALFRIVELMKGVIEIDNLNIAEVPLKILRPQIAIIPQDPVLLSGDIRFQLDPFNQFSDLEVWEVLSQVNMADTVKSFPDQLQQIVKENGENLSQGQRQLLCIARALLKQAKILIVDEGTSAVDPYTDELIQKVLRNQSRQNGTTVVAIAHRLQTIIDFDRILVLGQGQILEYDTPQVLMSNENSVFSKMLSETGH